MKRIIGALFVAVLVSASCAQVPGDFGGTRVANWQDCPAGTGSSAYYRWQDGGFVRDGWACHKIASPQ